jgi:hypothetical protein
MPRYTGRSAFPFKKELAIGGCIWLTYTAPTVMLYFHAKPKVANICWAVIAGLTAFVVLPLLVRLWLTWLETQVPDVAPE